MKLVSIALPVLATALLGACASQPVPLQGQFSQVTATQAIDHDSTGSVVRWGGRIVEVTPQENRTCFEVVSTHLNVSGRPYRTDEVGGRFIACRAGFYDTALFEKNREVTFTGRIEGYQTRKIGQYDYRFPKLAADVVYLWPERARTEILAPPMPFLYYPPYYNYGPGWGPIWRRW
ncbi:MAG: Slp family lipoprotein [Luteimonas sp.]